MVILILNFSLDIFLITVIQYRRFPDNNYHVPDTLLSIHWRRLQNITVFVMNRPVLNWPCDELSTWWTDRVESTCDESTGDETTGHQKNECVNNNVEMLYHWNRPAEAVVIASASRNWKLRIHKKNSTIFL